MITDEQKRKVKRLVNKYRFIKRKNKFVEHSLEGMYLLDKFDNDFNLKKYEDIKRYTENE